MSSQMLQFGDFAPEFRDPHTARVVVLPVAYDGTSTWVKGADRGPAAILKASYNLEFYDIQTGREVFREGIFTDAPLDGFASVDTMVAAVHQAVRYWLGKDKFPVLLGGEHSVSIGAFTAAAEAFENLTILQIDAHADLRDTYHGSRYNHACVMARAKEMCPIVQVGIRSMDKAELSNMDRDRVFFAHQISELPRRQWIDQVVSRLSENVYLTIDLDGFDPSVMPATGTPEPGGLGWYDVVELIRAVCTEKKLVGFDVVELCPHEAHWGADFLAAKLVYTTLTAAIGR